MIKVGVADYGIFVWEGGWFDYEERLNQVAKIGYDGIERISVTCAEDAMAKAILNIKKGTSFGTCRADIPENSIKWSAALGCKYIWNDVANIFDMEKYAVRINTLCEAAERYGIKVLCHNHLGNPVEKQEEIEELLERCPKAGLLLDTGHLKVAGGDPVYILKKYYDRVGAVHLKNWQTKNNPDAKAWYEKGYFCGLTQGDTYADNKEVVEVLLDRGFDGWVYVEHDTHLRNPYIDLKESYNKLVEWGIRR